MVIKPSVSFVSKDSNAPLATRVDTIVSMMTNNPPYPDQQSGIAEVATLNADFKTAIFAAADGGRMAAVALVAARAALVVRLRTLAYYVQLHCNNDMETLLSSGFPVQKPTRTPSVMPPAPTVVSLVQGPSSGTVALKVRAMRSHNALVYNWRYYLASAPTAFLSGGQTGGANTLFTHLTVGGNYFFQCCVTNTAGISDWSTPVSLIVN